MMFKRLVLPTILGGLIAFGWSAVSWMALPWHSSTFKKFKDESAVVEVLEKNAGENAVYAYPYCPGADSKLSAEEKRVATEKAKDAMRRGPVFMTIYNPVGSNPDDMGTQMTMGLVLQMIAALLITLILLQTEISFMGRVGVTALVGLFAGLVGHLPNWIWMGYPADFVLVNVADLLIAWLLAGFAMAGFASKS